MTPLYYGLCQQTVTLYGMRNGSILRRVAENCCLAAESGLTENTFGKSRLKKFLLIIPGEQDLQPGDRVFDGVGPEEINWQTFVPAFTDELYEIGRVKKQLWENEVTHTEGRESL